jgi:hypothetical protein
MKFARFLILAVVAAQPASAGPGGEGPTFKQAMTQSVEELAHRLFGASSSLVAEMERPSAEYGVRYFDSLEFASAPRSAGFAGLCEADTFWVGLERARGRDTLDGPTKVTGLSTGKVFRIVGGPVDIAKRMDADWDSLRRQCARAGRVLWTDADASGTDSFFGGRSEGRDLRPADASFAARAMALAMTSSDAAAAPACSEDPAEPSGGFCADPRRVVRALHLDRVSYLMIEPCPDQPATKCIDVRFNRGGGRRWEERMMSVEIATDTLVIDPPPDTIAIRSVKIGAYTNNGH